MSKSIFILAAALLLSACQSPHPPLAVESKVDLARFMGDWYVIANIPTFIEKDAYNAVESYKLDDDGTIATTFTFNKGGFDGERKEYTPRGFVIDKESNAVWGMRFVWPIKADYRIVYVSSDYSRTIVGREQRDYVWIMARTPSIPDADYAELLEKAKQAGYDLSLVKRVPQRAEVNHGG
jgi:apolipoprotein D and lipocalin family protein